MTDGEWGFYVQEQCCTSCGLPHGEAPDFVAWHVDPHVGCCIKKQPATPEEIEQMIGAMDVAELACFRYRGSDQFVQMRIRARGHASQIDREGDVVHKRASTGPWVEEPPCVPTRSIPHRTRHGGLRGWLTRLVRDLMNGWNA